MNIAKLNTVSLDDKTFIIKRGTSGGSSTPDTPSGEYYLARPNGWYWKYVGKDTIATDTEMYDVWYSWAYIYIASDGLYSILDGGRELQLPFVWSLPEAVSLAVANGQPINMNINGYAEKTTTYSAINEGFVGESFYKIMVGMSGMEISEEEFAAMMLSDYGLQRITKEEYESLITA